MARHKKKSSHHKDSIRVLERKHKHSKKKKKRSHSRKKKHCRECQIAKFGELLRDTTDANGSSSDEITVVFDSRTEESSDVQLIVGRNETVVSSYRTAVRNNIERSSDRHERESVIKLVGRTNVDCKASVSAANKNKKLDPKLLQECLLRIVGSELGRRASVETIELEPKTPPVEITISDDTLDSIPLPGEQPESSVQKVSSIPLPNDVSVAEVSSTVLNEIDPTNIKTEELAPKAIEIQQNKSEHGTLTVGTDQRPGDSLSTHPISTDERTKLSLSTHRAHEAIEIQQNKSEHGTLTIGTDQRPGGSLSTHPFSTDERPKLSLSTRPFNTDVKPRVNHSTHPTDIDQRPGTSCPVDICIKSKSKRKRVESSQNPITKRIWQYTTMGNAMASEGPLVSSPKHLIFDVLSYNVLSQRIMEDHPELYMAHNPQALQWNFRSKLLMQEFKNFNADILCLQEVQHSHLESFYSKLDDLGYSGIYKQRTGNKVDGVAIYYKKSVFNLTDYTTVEFYQPGVEVLDRDNVALVAKLAPKMRPQERIVVATTHLLFNPRRHDVKLAQTQLLLAEVERFAFKEYNPSTGETSYWPVILTGDLNLEPHSGVFELLTTGSFQYEGMGHKALTPGYGRNLSKHLIPEDLDISDSCQHRTLVMQRQKEPLDHKSERKYLKIYNGDYMDLSDPTCKPKTEPSWTVAVTGTNENNVCLPQPHLWFGSGRLSHPLNLRSAYTHDPDKWYDNSQVSTYQGRWVLVDYIFYTCTWEQYVKHRGKDSLRLLARYKLYSEEQASNLGPIPNTTSPSDHYPLCAKFALVY